MRYELWRVQRHLQPIFFFLLCIIPLWSSAPATAQVFPEKTEISVGYQGRMQFFLDQMSKGYLVEMAAREKMLLQMVRNVAAEIKSRGTTAVMRDDPKFGPLYSKMDGLITEYGQELDHVVGLIAEIDSLKNIMESERRFGMADQFASLKDSLVVLIDNRDLYRFFPTTKGDMQALLQEYNFEIDSLVTFYSRLTEMEARLDPTTDHLLLDRIKRQKYNISEYLKVALPDSALTGMTDAYAAEADQLLRVLTEINSMQKTAIQDNPELLSELDNVKKDVLSSVDTRIAALLGTEGGALNDGVRLSEIFREWRLTRLADFEAKHHEYLVMKTSLLESANDRQRSRMLQRDLSDALLNYVDGHYTLAELQLNHLIDRYGAYYKTFDAVYFFLAESKYARLQYEQAYWDYAELLANYPDNQYKQDIFLRQITISQTLGWKDAFFKHYDAFLEIEDSVDTKISDRIHYLAGYYSLQLRDSKSAQAAFEKIKSGSKYHLPALYLTGIAYANRSDYENAVTIFKKIVEMDHVPWADPNLAVIRNNALLRLGFIFYERRDYAQALTCFESVSRGANERDKVLIGSAWAHMKSGEYDATISNVDALFQDFLASDYTYEALVLTGLCKRYLNQPDEAVRDLRYVTKARGVLDLADRYNGEREYVLHQLDELERMEETVLDTKSEHMYDIVADLKASVQDKLIKMGYENGLGTPLTEDFASERREILDQISELESIIATAKQIGNEDVLQTATLRRERLVTTLSKYQSAKMISKANYFVDYPLATKESSVHYRQKILQNLVRDMDSEKRRINQNLVVLRELKARSAASDEAFVDLAALQQDLEALEDRMDRFQSWLKTYQVEDMQTDFDRWADYSGYGISDITIQELRQREQQIVTYSQNVVSIDNLLKSRKAVLEQRLAKFDGELDVIRRELEAEKLRLEKLEREKYFKNFYFDASPTETKG